MGRGAYGDKLRRRARVPRQGLHARDCSGRGRSSRLKLVPATPGRFRPARSRSPLDGVAATEHVGFEEVQDTGVDITKAPFLFSIGRGVEDKDELPRFEALAERFGATLSVSRPLVDAGWVPSARQVGQSGKTVKPRVYLALGISGAVQHLAGMRTAETIIAVNTDPEAPIFGVAHYGAVADLFEVADELERAAGLARRGAAVRGDQDAPGVLGLHDAAEGPLVRARGDLGVCVPVRRLAADRALPARQGRPVAPGRVARAAGAVGRRPGAFVLASHDRAPRPHGGLGSRRDLLRLHRAVRGDGDPGLRHRLPHAGVRRRATSTATSTWSTRKC